MLLALMAMYWHAGTTDIPTLLTHKFPADMQWWLWLAFFASFAVKLPMWPVHTWLPDAHVEAPTAGSVILAGILLKMGGYGFLRFSLPMFPLASQEFAPLVFALSIVAIVYTSLVALAQEDVKKLIAYSSVAHMGFVTMGIFSFTVQGVDGAIFQMLSHGLVSAALFLCVGVVYDRMHTREIAAYGGLVNRMPMYAFVFMVFTLANVGLPGTSGFIGEFLTLLGAFKANTWVAFLATFGVILSAAYALYLYRRMIFGPLEKPSLEGHHRSRLPRGGGVHAARAAGRAVRLLSCTAARCHGGVGEEARLQLRGGHQGRLGHEHALGDAKRWTTSRHTGRSTPSSLLIVGAMALLMLGVFRPESDREAEAIGWLAIGLLGLAAWFVLQQPEGSSGSVRRRVRSRWVCALHEGADARRLGGGAALVVRLLARDEDAEIRIPGAGPASDRRHADDDIGQRSHLALCGPRAAEPGALRAWPPSAATTCARARRASSTSCWARFRRACCSTAPR